MCLCIISDGSELWRQVYKADLDESTPVAVKVVKSSSISRADVQAFAHAVNVLWHVRHTNVIQLLGACIQEVRVSFLFLGHVCHASGKEPYHFDMLQHASLLLLNGWLINDS